MDDYKIHGVEIYLSSGIKLKVEATTFAGVRKLLDDLAKENFSIKPSDNREEKGSGAGDRGAPKSEHEQPASRIELAASVPLGTLVQSKIVAFKDNVPQFLRPSAFHKVTDAVLFLLYCVETGLKKPQIDYDSFKGLFESQNVKSGSPLPMLVNNLKNSGYINKLAYENNRRLALSAKGQTKAIEVLQSMCNMKNQ